MEEHKFLYEIMLAAFGGSLAAGLDFKANKKNISIMAIIAKITVCWVCGVAIGMIFASLGLSNYIVAASSALGGLFGIEAISYLFNSKEIPKNTNGDSTEDQNPLDGYYDDDL